MRNVLIVHGVGGFPEENWFPWLKGELEGIGCNVLVPQFETPENQTLDEWMKVVDKHSAFLNENAFVVGHSLGVPFLLNVLEKYKVKAAFLVAGFTGIAGNKFDDSMKTFAQRDFDWAKIKANCDNFVIFHADNDPYIKLEKAEEMAEHLGVNVTLVAGAGHFNSATGYSAFPLLLEKMRFFL